jgi:hypothetical protein
LGQRIAGPSDILSVADEIGDDAQRTRFITGLFSAGESPVPDSKFKNLITALPQSDREELFHMEHLFVNLAQKEHRAAAELALELEFPPESYSWEGIFKTWLQADPAAAADWLFPLRQKHERPIYPVERAMEEWMERDPLPALASLDRFFPEEREHNRQMMLEHLFRSARDQFTKLLPQLTGENKAIGDYLLNQEAIEKAVHQPDHGVAFLLKMAQSEHERTRNSAELHLAYAGNSYGRTDPMAGLKALSGMPEGESRALYLGGLVNNWTQQDARAASEWARSLPKGPDRNAAAHSIAIVTREKDPAAAFHWAVQMDDGKDKSQLCERILLVWQKIDAPAAANAANAASIPLPPPRKVMGRGIIGDGFGGPPAAKPEPETTDEK